MPQLSSYPSALEDTLLSFLGKGQLLEKLNVTLVGVGGAATEEECLPGRGPV